MTPYTGLRTLVSLVLENGTMALDLHVLTNFTSVRVWNLHPAKLFLRIGHL